MVSIGFVLSDEQFIASDLVEYGVAAEQAGFDMVWNSDHFHPWQDNQGHSGFAWVILAALGQRTDGITMGTGVTCPTYRYNPVTVAHAFASLGVLYPGRIFLGVGTGEAVNEWPAGARWSSYDERSDRLAEAVMLIRQLWRGDWVTYQGDYFQVSEAKLYDPPPQMIPIYIAAAGEKSMNLAGLHGDGLITDLKTLQKPESMNAYRQGAEAGGKNADDMPILVENWVCVGDRDEALQAAKKWRFIPKSFEKYVNNPDPRAIQRDAEQNIPLEQAIEDWVIGGDPDIHIQGIQKLVDNGVTHIFVHSAQEDQHRVIDFYAREVLPHIQHEPMRPMAVDPVAQGV
jgi:TAT-translocated FGD2 family F420-dependent dehydrogenase